MVVLEDGVAVWLEPLDARDLRPAAGRARAVRGATVTVRGTAHERMPAQGESPLAPCLSGVHDLEEEA